MKLLLRGLRMPVAMFGLAAGASLLLPVTAGCDDDGGDTGGGSACAKETDEQGCFDYTCVTEGPQRSFANDVLPIFENSCSLAASCHGDPSSPDQASGYRPYLGEVDQVATPSDIPLILSLIVDQDSHAANMKIVAPGSPETSFLMHKMDGDLSCASISCTPNCGTPMPQGGDVLPRASRDVVRDWIKQGAQNN